jgi:peptide/nickel transport system substrate-binding protein
MWWGADYPSPSSVLDTFTGCGGFIAASPLNNDMSEYCSPRVERLIRAALAAEHLSPTSAARQWTAIDQAVSADAPIIPLTTYTRHNVVSTSAQNVVINPVWGLLFDQLES